MTAVPVLQELARLVTGEPEDVVRRLLALACEQLAMDVALVGVGAGERLELRMSVRADGSAGPAALPVPDGQEWCDRVLADGVVLLPAAGVAGAALREPGGTAFGVLCAYRSGPHATLNPRDGDVLAGLAEVLAPLVLATAPAPPEATPAAPTLGAVAGAVERAEDVEGLTRPLLEALADLTGLGSAYLTVVHEAAGVQEIRYARNARDGFEMPEGLVVPWHDTLCKRALEEDRPCVSDVPAVWGDSEAARELGIQVYVSVPVRTADGRLWGTLCAADSVGSEDAEAHLPTMRLFARLIGVQAEREEALRRAREEADNDLLTGCSSRRVVDPWLSREVASTSPDETIVVAYADLNSFKAVNDTLGHAAGDAVLAEVGRRLRSIARPDDLVARIGGDEFLVAARLPRAAAGRLGRRVRTALSFSLDWQDASVRVGASVGTATSDDHDAGSIVGVADAAMYDAKRAAALARR